jgi:hypothetical protein
MPTTGDGRVDEEGFELVYREHANAVLAYACSRGDAERAREVVGETFPRGLATVR